MSNKQRYILITVLLLGLAWMFFNKKNSSTKPQQKQPPATSTENIPAPKADDKPESVSVGKGNIDELTAEAKVVPYVKANGKLPDYYITKGEAKKQGWIASKGNLCDALPGRAIGGDIFTNRQKLLPVKQGRKWFEADLNYNCGRRNADRILYSSDGLVFVTHDHYKTVQEK